MQQHFMNLADYLTSQLTGAEIATSYLVAEKSDFVRFNQAKVRQPGSVTQANCKFASSMVKANCCNTWVGGRFGAGQGFDSNPIGFDA